MMHASRAFVVAAAVMATVVVAAAAWSPSAQVWEHVARADGAQAVTFYVGLRMDEAALDQVYHQVTDHDSPQRGQYLDVHQLREAVAPPAAVVAKVRSWLQTACGAATYESLAGDVITAVAPAAGVERGFSVALSTWRHRGSGRLTTRAGAAVPIPAAVAPYVDVVVGLSDFFESKHEQRTLSAMKRRGERMAAVAGGELVDNMPYIAAINGNSTAAQIEFDVLCKNGMPTGSASAPCSDVPGQPVATSFHLVAVPLHSATANYTIDLSDAGCHTSPVRTSVACDFVVPVPPYTPTVFSLSTVYADGSYSRTFTHPAYAPRPPTTPQLLHDLYSIPEEYRVATNSSNSQAIVSFEEQYWSNTDLEAFWSMFDIAPNHPHVIGFNNFSASAAGGEATLDVQMITGLGQNVNTTTWSFPTGDYIMNWAWAVGNNTLPPITTSISYGDTEVGYQFKTGYGIAYIRRMNLELQKMAVRGLTVLAGAGDAGWTNVGERGNDLSGVDPTCGIMRAFYPSESPFVTSMSATFVTQSGEATISVRGGRSWTTGGGFSNLTARQAWQAPQVASYLSGNHAQLPPSRMFNASGRGYPDLVAVGDNNICVWRGQVFPLGGTSASGPIMAGIVSLLNDALLNAGRPVVGHFNPTLYRWAASDSYPFNDVTVGRNNDGDMQPPSAPYPIFCDNGFPASKGWDAATGLGSPVFKDWVALALAGK